MKIFVFHVFNGFSLSVIDPGLEARNLSSYIERKVCFFDQDNLRDMRRDDISSCFSSDRGGEVAMILRSLIVSSRKVSLVVCVKIPQKM